jgi:hypothetical protein
MTHDYSENEVSGQSEILQQTAYLETLDTLLHKCSIRGDPKVQDKRQELDDIRDIGRNPFLKLMPDTDVRNLPCHFAIAAHVAIRLD